MMDDKEKRISEEKIEGLSEEDIAEFESGEDDDVFDDGREDVFETGEDEGTFDVDGNPDESGLDFDDEMAYSTVVEKRGGFFSKISHLPNISAGWLGVLLIILIIVFLFIPKAKQQPKSDEMMSIQLRLKNIEEQLVDVSSLSKRVEQVKPDDKNDQQLNNRMDNLEKNLAAMTDQLQREVDNIKKKLSEVKKERVVEKVVVKPEAKPVDTQYHTVKKGENLYRIALKYGLTESQILDLNNLKPKAVIYPGQKLRVRP